jgi:hypothetical protein
VIDEALRALLEGLVDYAGLFPPAGLDMDPALRNYLGYLDDEDRWMLGRFVVPAGRRDELMHSLPSPDTSIDLSVLARADLLHDDAAALPAEAIEILLTDDLVAGLDHQRIAMWIDHAREEIRRAGRAETPLFLESPTPKAMTAVVRGIAAARDGAVSLKIRTGGIAPGAFPGPEQVAATVIACRDAGVAFKATAGLHHPVQHFNEEVGAHMHGFLNLFGGAVLAAEHGLDEAALIRILEDEDPSSWRFTAGTLSWRDLSAPAASVREARKSLATSFGSCSFDDPRDDLRALGLLPTRTDTTTNN